jgi:hypothetical protein
MHNEIAERMLGVPRAEIGQALTPLSVLTSTHSPQRLQELSRRTNSPIT